MSFTEKIDVLDLLIQVLRDHEAKLDELVERLDNATRPIGDYEVYKWHLKEAERELKEKARSQVDDTENMIRFYDRFPGEC